MASLIYLELLLILAVFANGEECVNNQLYPNPYDCSTFYSCSLGQLQLMECPFGLHFNEKRNKCDYPENANCLEISTEKSSEESTEAPSELPPSTQQTTEALTESSTDGSEETTRPSWTKPPWWTTE